MTTPRNHSKKPEQDQTAGGYKPLRFVLAGIIFFSIPFIWWAFSLPSQVGYIFGIYPPTKRILFLLAVTYLLSWAAYFVLSRVSRSGKIINLAMCSASIIFCIVIVELPALLNVFDYRTIFQPQEVNPNIAEGNPWNLPDPELIHIHRPNSKYKAEIPGDLVQWHGIATDRRYPVDIAYDSRGFRNDRELTEADIALIGDSFIEAGLIPKDELLATFLEKNLNRTVVNLGQSGYGPQQELLVLKRFGIPLKPKTVLWFFFEGNDLQDVKSYEEKLRKIKESKDNESTYRERSFILNFPHILARFTSPKRKDDSPDAEKYSCRLKGSGQYQGEKMYFVYGGRTIEADDLDALEKTKRIITEAHKLSVSRDARFVLIFIPSKFRVFKNLCGYPKKSYIENWVLNDLPQRFGQWAETQNIEYIDLTQPIVSATENGQLTYFLDDGHWNSKGNTIGAEVITEYLKRSDYSDHSTQKKFE